MALIMAAIGLAGQRLGAKQWEKFRRQGYLSAGFILMDPRWKHVVTYLLGNETSSG